MDKEVYKEYATKIEITITQMGRDETEGLEKVEGLLKRAQFIDDYDILDIKKRTNHHTVSPSKIHIKEIIT